MKDTAVYHDWRAEGTYGSRNHWLWVKVLDGAHHTKRKTDSKLPTWQQWSVLLVILGFCWDFCLCNPPLLVTNFRNLETGVSKHMNYENKMLGWWGLLPPSEPSVGSIVGPHSDPDSKYAPGHSSKSLGASASVGDTHKYQSSPSPRLRK